MKIIKEFILEKTDLSPQNIYLPKDAKVIGVRDSDKGLILSAITTSEGNINSLPELRTFKICANDEKIYAEHIKYIGSFTGYIGSLYVVEIL